MDPISVDQFLRFFHLQKMPLYDYLFSISMAVVVMPTNLGLISLEDIVLLCQMTGRNQLALQIVHTQFEVLDINHDGFLTTSQFCHFIAVTINLWEPIYRIRFALIARLFPSKDYYERILERRLNINEIKEYQQSHKGKYKKLSCIKYIKLFLKRQPHPDHYDYEPSGNELNKYNFATRSMKLMDNKNILNNNNNNNKTKRSNSDVVPDNKNIINNNNVSNYNNNNNAKVTLTLDSLIGFYICKYKSMNSQKKNNNASNLVIPMNTESSSEVNDSTPNTANDTNTSSLVNNNVVNISPPLKPQQRPSQRPSQQLQIPTPVHRYNHNTQHKSHFKMKYLRLKYPYKMINTIDHYYDLNYKKTYKDKRKKTNDNNNQCNGEVFSARMSNINNNESFKSEDSSCFVFNSNAYNNRNNRPSSSILKANRFTKTSSTLSENQSYFGGGGGNNGGNGNAFSPSIVYSSRMNAVTPQTKMIVPNAFLESPSHANKMQKGKQKPYHMDFGVVNESESNAEGEK